jgi:hypothetical protein
MNPIPVARLWHKKGKLEYYTMLQLHKYLPNIEFEYHIILDQPDYKDEWSKKIDDLPVKCTWYSKEDMHDYLKSSGYGDEKLISSIPKFIHFYHILINHYLRRVYSFDYVLTIEYDVLFNSEDLSQLEEFLINKTPFGIVEPANPGCDKALAQQLSQIFGQNIIKYSNIGINAGFKGLNLKVFDEFLNPSTFNILLSIFNFSGIYNEDGTEKTGWTRTTIDTQEQSFHSLMNALSPDYQLLNPEEYYVFPYWVDMDHLMKSKVIHFIGHEKPQEMLDIVNKKIAQFSYEDNL